MAISIKATKLENTLQGLRTFLSQQNQQDQELQRISQHLQRFETSLKSEKVQIQFVAPTLNLAEVLQQSLSDHLPHVYQTSTVPIAHLVEIPQNRAIATLTYPLTQSGKIEQMQYPLSVYQTTRIGRDPSCEISLDTLHYPYISWHHADIEAQTSDTSTEHPTWMIRDTGSRHGIYINGSEQRLKSQYALQTGDRITLQPFSTQSIEFQFNLSQQLSHKQFYNQQSDCDILCVVVELDQILTEDVITLVKTIKPDQPIQLIYIVNASPEKLSAHLAGQEINIQQQISSNLKVEFFAVELNSLKAHPSETAHFGIEKLLEFLKQFTARKPEEKLFQRLAYQINCFVQYFEKQLDNREIALRNQIQTEEEKILAKEKSTVKPAKLFKEINEEKVWFFKRCRVLIGRSKTEFLDEFSPDSITCKLRLFLESLSVRNFKQKGHQYICLETDGLSHQGLSQVIGEFSQVELTQWITQELERVFISYEGGINRLLQEIQAQLVSITDFSEPIELKSKFHYQTLICSIADPIADFSTLTRIPSLSVFSYVLKKLRSHWMSFGIMISMVAVLGISFNGKSMIPSTLDYIGKEVAQLLSISPLLANFINLSILLTFLGLFLILSYVHDRDMKLEEAADKLRNDVGSYYQSAIKRLVEKVMQDFNDAVDSAERHLESYIEAATESSVNRSGDSKQSKMTPEHLNLERLKRDQKQIQDERAALQKIKRSL
jgi:hypothetical protein